MMAARKIKVLFLIDRLMPGGTEKQLLELSERLSRDNFVPVIGFLERTDYEESLNLSTPTVNLAQHAPRFMKAVKLVHRLRNYIKDEEIDIVQTFFEDSAILGAVAVRSMRKRPYLIGTRRNLYHWIREEPWIFRAYRISGRLADSIIVNSYSVAEKCKELEGVNEDKIVVIQNGIDLSQYQGMSKEVARNILGIQSSGPVIGVIGNWRPVKGQADFLRAASNIQHQCPAATFVLAGYGPQRHELQDLAMSLGIGKRCKFIEGCTNSPTLVASLDVAVQPSRSESFSNVLIEYMAAGRPVVATRVGDAERIVDHGIDGLLVQPGNPFQLGAAILELCEDEEMAAQLGRSASNKIAARWSMEKLVDEHAALYTQVFARERVGHVRTT